MKKLGINDWLHFIFETQHHKKLNQITTIKRYWTKTGEDRDPLDSFYKNPAYWAPGETLADQHSYHMQRLLEIEKVVPGVKLGKVDLGMFALEEVFENLREYVEILTPDFIHREWMAGRRVYDESTWHVAMIDFEKFQAYTVEEYYKNQTSPDADGNPRYVEGWSRCQGIYITVPRININYNRLKDTDTNTLAKTARLYVISTGDAFHGDLKNYITPELKYPKEAKDFFIYMQKTKHIFGEKTAVSKIMLWTKNQLNSDYSYPTDNIKTYKDYQNYLAYCRETCIHERYYKLPPAAKINYSEQTFAEKVNITQKDIDDYISYITKEGAPIEIINEI